MANVPDDRLQAEADAPPMRVQTETVVAPAANGRPMHAAAPPATAPINTTAGKIIVDMPESEVHQLIDAAESARHAGNHETALTLYRRALERSPMQSQARLRLAGLLRERGRSSEALAVLEEGHTLRAQPVLALATGRLLSELGRQEEALNWLHRGRENAQPADFALMGALYAQTQRHVEAVMAYQRALAADASQGGWFLGLGVSLEALGQREEARAAYRRALERGSFKPEVEKFLRDKSDLPG